MKLTYLGEELDSTKEKEILSGSKFGFNVIVVYKIDSWMSKYEKEQVVDIFNNCTEVHNLFESFIPREKRIAFESDIHHTGCTRNVDDIESVEIHIATKKRKRF
jgi:hypothetical protein